MKTLTKAFSFTFMFTHSKWIHILHLSLIWSTMHDLKVITKSSFHHITVWYWKVSLVMILYRNYKLYDTYCQFRQEIATLCTCWYQRCVCLIVLLPRYKKRPFQGKLNKTSLKTHLWVGSVNFTTSCHVFKNSPVLGSICCVTMIIKLIYNFRCENEFVSKSQFPC